MDPAETEEGIGGGSGTPAIEKEARISQPLSLFSKC